MGLASAEGAGSTVVRRREAAGSPHQNAGRCEDGHDGHDREECLVRKRGGVDMRLVPRFVCRSERGAEQVVVVQNGTAASQNGRDVRVDDLDGVAADVFDCRGVVVGGVSPQKVSEADALHVRAVLAPTRCQQTDRIAGRERAVEREQGVCQNVNSTSGAGGEGSEQVARAGRGSRIRRVDVTRKGADRYGSGAGRCQVRGAGDVGGCPVEGGCRGIGAAVEVEHAGESSDEHEAQCSCKPVSTKKLCDFGHVASLL